MDKTLSFMIARNIRDIKKKTLNTFVPMEQGLVFIKANLWIPDSCFLLAGKIISNILVQNEF